MHSLSTRSIIIADIAGGVALVLMAVVFFILPRYQKDTAIEDESYATREAQQIASECRGKPWHECYKSGLAKLTREKGLGFGERVLSLLQDIDPEARNCHVLAHVMAREAVKRDPSQWQHLLDSINVGACGSGFLHGILEARIGIDSSLKIDAALAENLCGAGSDAYKKRMCFHFMGHVFLVDTEADVSLALSRCRQISAFEFRYECSDGLFMEDHQKLALAEHAIAPLPEMTRAYVEQLSRDCMKYNGDEGKACWQEMGEMYAKISAYDPRKVDEGCRKAPTAVEQQSCYLKGVVVMAVYTGFDTKTKLLDLCLPYADQNDSYRNCTNTALFSFMFYSPKYIDRGVTLCSSLEAASQQSCFETLAGALKTVLPSVIAQKPFCERIPLSYRQACGAN